MSSISKFWRQTSSLLLTALLSCVILEFGCRLLFLIYAPTGESEKNQELKVRVGEPKEDRQFFDELTNFRSYPYKAFVGWRAQLFEGESLNIDAHGHRKTTEKNVASTAPRVFLYGGSTIWGYGVADSGTIPSQIQDIDSSRKYFNFGEQAWNSRQSLNELIAHIDELKPGDTVIFYDGVNDAIHNCKAENGYDGHSRTGYIRRLLADKNSITVAFRQILSGLYSYKLASHVVNKNKLSSGSDRYINPCGEEKYARDVADFVLTSWKTAENLLESHKVSFLCALQPNPYTLSPPSRFANHEEFRTSLVNVYRFIKARKNNLKCFADLSDALTKDLYVDNCCHLKRSGNREIAKLLLSILNNGEDS